MYQKDDGVSRTYCEFLSMTVLVMGMVNILVIIIRLFDFRWLPRRSVANMREDVGLQFRDSMSA